MIRQLHSGSSSDEGMSVVMVVISFTVLFAIVLTTSLYVLRSLRPTAAYTDSEKALSAAESGITDYLTRAGADPTYLQRTDCENAALQAPTTDATCGWDEDTAIGWAPVDRNKDADASPAYHYEVLGWDEQNGTEASQLSLRVTGRSGAEYRTVEVQATRTSTEQYAGYQNHWALPLTTCVDSNGARIYQRTPTVYQGSNTPRCLRTLNAMGTQFGWYNGTGSITASSGAYDWPLHAWANPVNGDFFTNDIGFINPGPASQNPDEQSKRGSYQVNGVLSVANPFCTDTTFAKNWKADTVLSTDCAVLPTNTSSGVAESRVTTTEAPQLSATQTLPYDTTSLATAPGCRYYGPTRIVAESDGTLRVWSKQSVYPELTIAVASSDGTTPTCGTSIELGSDEGAHIDVPADMVVYVADLPADVVSNHGVVNDRLEAGEIGGNATYGYLPIGETLASVLDGTPTQTTAIRLDTSTYSSSRYRTKGNLWIEGRYQGKFTVGSSGAVLITGDLVAADGTAEGTDQLGIVANDVTLVDHRLIRLDRVARRGSEIIVQDMAGGYFLYIEGVDAASGTLGDWPHDYNRNRDQVQIDAAIQVLTSGFGYQDGGICAQSSPWNSYDRYDGWTGLPDKGLGVDMVPFYFAFPGVEHGDRDNSLAGSRPSFQATVTEPADGSATIDVTVTGSVAQNYLGTTGVRTEFAHTSGYSGASDSWDVVTWNPGSCGMDLTVDYDDRLRSTTPPYLLRFTDVGWQRGASTEVTTPASVRS